MGVMFLGEQPGLGALAALALILSGIGLSEIGRRRATARAADG
jgi:drug/metabolite transporter (DMT)-like permease